MKTTSEEAEISALQDLRARAGDQLHRGDVGKASETYRSAVDMGKATLGENHEEVVRTEVSLAWAYRSLGRIDEALRLYEECERAIDRNPGISSATSLEVFTSVAELASGRGDVARAGKAYDRAMALVAGGAVGEEARLEILLPQIAAFYALHGQPREAERAYDSLLSLTLQRHGEHSERLAEVLSAMGEAYLGDGRLEDADRAFRRACAIKEHNWGPSSQDVAWALIAVALADEKRADFKAAMDHRRRVVEILGGTVGKDTIEYAEAKLNLATAERLAGSMNQAIGTAKEAVGVAEKVLGEGSSGLVPFLEEYALTARTMGLAEEAERATTRAVNLKRTRPSGDVPPSSSKPGNLKPTPGAPMEKLDNP